MYNQNRYDSLLERHRRIDQKLDSEMKRPLPDYFTVQGLKRQKLRIKDEMKAWELLMGPAIPSARTALRLNA